VFVEIDRDTFVQNPGLIAHLSGRITRVGRKDNSNALATYVFLKTQEKEFRKLLISEE
jgi:hypothetical protein